MMTPEIRVLLVQDVSSDPPLITNGLSPSSVRFHVDHVDRLAAAEAFLEQHDVDVVLLVLGLPDDPGLEHLRASNSLLKKGTVPFAYSVNLEGNESPERDSPLFQQTANRMAPEKGTVPFFLADSEKLGQSPAILLDALNVLQGADERCPVVVLTDDDDEQNALAAMRAGAQDYLTREMIDDRHLVRSLTYAIHRKRTELALRDGAKLLEEETRVDPMTKIFNRRALYECLDREWSRAERSRIPFSCAVLDIDLFKRINDTYGHAAGDETLVSVAETIRDQIRGHDILSRLGGDEFCVLLPATSERAALLWADRARQAVNAATIPTNRGPIQVTISIGIAQNRPDHRHAQQLLDQADQAMLVSKQRGRNKVTAYSAIDDGVGACQFDEIDHGPYVTAPASDYMTTPIRCLRDADSILAAAQLLLDMGVNSVPVVDGAGRLVGIISEKDLVELQPAQQQWHDPVGSIMNTTVVSFPQDTPLERIRQFFSRVALRRVVIVDDERPVGVLSRSNLLRCYHDWVVANLMPATP